MSMNTIFTRRNAVIACGMATAVGLTAAAMIASAQTAGAGSSAIIGSPAPAFTGVTSTGETISLGDYAGKTVILEWTNDGCPFVQKHYDESYRNMQTLQADAAAEDIVWLSVISSAPGEQGHVSGAEAEAINEGRGASPSAVILDVSGDIGRLYDAKTTPHMYIVTPDGTLVYNGAIDSIRSADTADIPKATNYVTASLASLESGQAPDPAVTRPYGCSVKY